MPEPLFEKIALVGIGLIGSSLARVVRREDLARHDRHLHPQRSRRSPAPKQLGLGDSYTTDAAEAVKDADLVIVSVPVGSSGAVAKEIAPALKKGAILTDVGSTGQASVIAQMSPYVPRGRPFHPRPSARPARRSPAPTPASPSCFENRWCIFTPLPGTDPAALEKLSEFWRRCGSNIDTMDPDHHDKTLAIVSHLPHIIAYNIVGTADDLETVTKSEVIKYSRLRVSATSPACAASDRPCWRDVCLHNKDAILEMLARFSEDLAALQRMIRWGEGDKLFDLFTRTRAVRRSIIEAGQDIDVADFGRQAVEHEG